MYNREKKRKIKENNGNMKTLKKDNELKRVKDIDSENMLKFGWSYCPKSEWKNATRKDVKKPEKVDGNKKRGKNSTSG